MEPNMNNTILASQGITQRSSMSSLDGIMALQVMDEKSWRTISGREIVREKREAAYAGSVLKRGV